MAWLIKVKFPYEEAHGGGWGLVLILHHLLKLYRLMSPSSSSTVLLPEPAVLLVLLPPTLFDGARLAAAQTTASLLHLQSLLGPDIRVLKVDEASHPAVVRSFGTPELPACVLMRQGVELWRQHGLPEDDKELTALLEAARAG